MWQKNMSGPSALHASYKNKYLSYCILQTSSTRSSARPATNRRNTVKRAEANARWGAIHFEMQKYEKNADREVKGIALLNNGFTTYTRMTTARRGWPHYAP